MHNFSTIFFHFMFFLSVGTLSFLPLVDSKLTGVAHSKLILIISAVLSLLASLGLGLAKLDFTIFTGITLVYSFFVVLMWSRHKEIRTVEIYFYYLLNVLLGLTFIYFLPISALNRLFLACSALILGLINYIMILGHYYLVVPKLTVRPLLIGLKFYWAFFLLRIILIYPYHDITNFWTHFAYLLMGKSLDSQLGFDISEMSLIFFQQISSYIANPILSYFAYRLCLIRSTQSATGIFYVMVFFALIAEMLSLYLLTTKGIRF